MVNDSQCRRTGRRQFLKYTGAVSTISFTGISGCLTEGSDRGDYPNETIDWIIPFSPGGGTDVYAREMVQHLDSELGVNLAIENISGAASLRGTGEMMYSDPNGYTIASYNPPSTPVSEIVNPQEFNLQEATGLGVFATTPFVIVAHPSYDIEDYGDLIDRYTDGELNNFGGKERGGVDHVMAKVMENTHGFDWRTYVGYDGTGAAVEATISNEIPAALSTDTAAAAPVADGNLDLVAVLASDGSSVFSETEPITDRGYDEIDYITQLTRGTYAPPDTPNEVVEVWEDAIETIMSSSQMEEWSQQTGNPITTGTGQDAEDIVDETYELIPNAVDLDEVRESTPW